MSVFNYTKSPWADGRERGRLISDFLEKEFGPIRNKKILDVGCGLGGISITLAESSARVFSFDYDFSRVKKAQERRLKADLGGFFLLQSDALELPFKENAFDIMIMNGVLEWIAYDKQGDPVLLQRHALAEARRVLKMGGVLYLAIENRLYPFNIFCDPHLKLPFVCMLPKGLRNLLTYLVKARPYQTPVHSYWRLRSILKDAGFKEISMYAGLIHYQYPFIYLSLDRRNEQRLSRGDLLFLRKNYLERGLAKGLSLKLILLKTISKLGLLKYLCHNFVALVRK